MAHSAGPACTIPGHGLRHSLPERRNFLIAIACCLSVSLAQAETLIPIDAEQAAKLDIRTVQPQPAEAVPLLSAAARVVVPPGREFMVSAPHAGLASRIDVAVGDTVKAGQVLAQLASPAFLAVQREALQAANEHRLADSVLTREQKLLAEGAIPQRRWEETRSLHDTRAASDNEVRQVLNIAGMSPAEVERLLKTQKLSDRLEIKSPMAGMVLEVRITTGQQVEQLAPLFRVADASRLWLEIDLPPEQVDKIAPGDIARVAGAKLSAKITGVGRQVLPNTHSVVARAELDNGGQRLYPGQTVGVELLRAEAGGVFRLPAQALARQAGASFVFVKQPQGFVPRTVESLGQSGADLILRGALTPDDQVAVQGVAAIKAKWTEEKEP
jgi:cobalt-zinc-cadmium efflux system membrane fusion protein